MRSLELFSGVGGLAKGLEQAGLHHLGFVEFKKEACTSLRSNFCPEIVFEQDIRDFNFSQFQEVDVVAGGPPCQPFSLGGKHKASDDHRDMFPYAIRAIEVLKPKAFIFENVKGLLRPTFSEYFDYIISRLSYPDFSVPESVDWQSHLRLLKTVNYNSFSGIKYNVVYKLLNAADYGVPQTRERVVIIGIRSDLKADWAFPKTTHSEDKLIWEKFISKNYWDCHSVSAFCNVQISENERKNIERVKKQYGVFAPDGLPWGTVRDALRNIPDPRSQHGLVDHIYKNGAKSYPGHTGSEIDWPAKTIKAGGHGVPGGENMIRFEDGSVRYLTVYEAKILQTFPCDFWVSGAWGEAMRQIGNAVPVKLANILGKQLCALFESQSSVDDLRMTA